MMTTRLLKGATRSRRNSSSLKAPKLCNKTSRKRTRVAQVLTEVPGPLPKQRRVNNSMEDETSSNDDCTEIASTSASYTALQLSSEDEYDENTASAAIENEKFRKLCEHMNAVHTADEIVVPKQLSSTMLRGIGDPDKVWGLMLRADEAIRPSVNVLEKHPAIRPHMRAVLVDWMMEVCESEKQHRETFYLAVDYVDRHLSNSSDVPVDNFQLIGTTALFLASKYEEIYPPKLEHFVTYSDGACTQEEVHNMEQILLETLEWTLNPITAVHWLGLFMQLLGRKEVSSHELEQNTWTVPNIMVADFMFMTKVLDIAITDVRCHRFSYRELAAGVLFSCLEPQKLMSQITGYSLAQVAKVIHFLEPIVKFCSQWRSEDTIPQREGVRREDMYNIQTHGFYKSISEAMDTIEEERKKLELQNYEVLIADRRSPRRTTVHVQ